MRKIRNRTSTTVYRIIERPIPPIKRSTKDRYANQAFLSLQEAVRLAGDTIHDVIMELDIVVSDEWVDEVMLDLCGRQAIIKSQITSNGRHAIRTNMRLCNLIGYSSHLANLNQGAGLFQMRLFRGEDQ
jgi:translation elongation factor EF-G